MGTGTTPLQQLGDTNQIYFFSLRMDNDDKYRFLRAEDFDIWHRRMGDISSRCLEILSKEDGNCLSFLMKMGRHATCCAIGENAQQAHLKKATYDAGPPVLLTFSDLMRSITPEALGGYIYACKGTDSAKRRRGINLLKNKNDAVASLKTIQSGGRNPVDRASSAFAQTSKGSTPARSSRTTVSRRESCTSTLLSRHRDRRVSRNAMGGHWQGWCDASSRTPVYLNFCGENSYRPRHNWPTGFRTWD